LLELEKIGKKFDLPSGDSLTVLEEVTLRVDEGESIAIVGPSGSGKSTLLNIIGALERPSSGTILLSGQDITRLEDGELSRIRNRQIGFVFQLHHLLPQCSVIENVLIPTIPLGGGNAAELTQKAGQLLQRVGLGDRREYFPAQLSGGELQRVAVVRALINNPRLILADEPTGSLDRDSANKLGELLVSLNRQEQTTLIVVTHSGEIAQLMDRVYRLQSGTLVTDSTT
jgi:ABC-type lipoprotein export system ATPase subunit